MSELTAAISKPTAPGAWLTLPEAESGPELHHPASSASKRILDVLVAFLAILLFLPLLCAIALAIRLESDGPAIFRQRRTGLNGEIFTIYKLRTMRASEDGGAVRQATQGDVRVTALGAILRKLSLDELPQLFNVLKGDMSIVGPRPHAISHDNFYVTRVPGYDRRFRARPGLTGYAQVNGFRGEVRELQCMADRVAADNAYIQEWSFALDVLIVLKTIPLLLRDPRAY